MVYKIDYDSFLKQLIKRLSPAVILVALVAIVYVYLMQFVDHKISWVPYLVVLFALIKTIYFTFFTFKQVNKSIRQCHSFGQLLWIFGLLVLLIIFSYAADYSCIAAANTGSFQGFNTSDNMGCLDEVSTVGPHMHG